MPPSLALLDAVDARIKAQRQGLPVQPQQPAAPTPSAALAPGLTQELLDATNARIKAGKQPDPAQAPAIPPQPDPYAPPTDYVVRGASQTPVADLLAQRQQWAQSIRQPEWWAEGMMGGGVALGEWLKSLVDGADYEERMLGDPVYRELRRSAIYQQYQTSLRDAATHARAGNEMMARQYLRHADVYRRRLEALDKGNYGLTTR